MDIKLLENPDPIRKLFKDKFVMSWELFQDKLRQRIAEMDAQNHTIYDINWYNQAFMWDKIDSDFPRVHFREALLFLNKHNGNVYIMSEGKEHRNPGQLLYHGTSVINFVAQVDVKQLASLIEEQWLASFGLGKQVENSDSSILPEDLYVFDDSMTWFVVFTHEASDLNAQFSNRMKAAESRFCIVSKR